MFTFKVTIPEISLLKYGLTFPEITFEPTTNIIQIVGLVIERKGQKRILVLHTAKYGELIPLNDTIENEDKLVSYFIMENNPYDV